MGNKEKTFGNAIEKFKQFTSKYGKDLSRFLLVTLCIGLIIYFMPKEKGVYYGFKPNSPWVYEQLRAEFDFDIPKSNTEIEAEKDSVRKHFIPTFRQIGIPSEFYKAAATSVTEEDAEKKQLFNSLKGFFERGIIADSDTAYLNGNIHNKIFTYRDSTGKRRLESREFITVSVAREMLQSTIKDTTGISSLVKPNYRCDTRTSRWELEKQIKAIDPIHAHIKEGEKIIGTGEIVNIEAEKTIKTYLDLKRDKEKTKSANNWKYLLFGQILFIIVCMVILLAYFNIYKKEIMNRANKFIFTTIATCVFPILVGIIISHGGISVFTLPFAILPITLCLFIDESTAFVTTSISMAMCSIMLDAPYEFILLQTLAGCSVILSLKELNSRAQMFRCVIVAFLTYAIAYLCYKVVRTAGFSEISPLMFAYFAVSSILTLLIYPLMLVIERTFGFISNVTLIELSNLNCKLLQRMSQEAPGTFQHSMQVGNLAAEAAIAIDANPLEVRTGALYHDIGKLGNPIMFTENQNGGVNPHDTLTAVESAQAIIKHVTDGLATAEREGLPKKIREFIATHHGMSKTGYFYITYKNEHPDEVIDETLFTYPGPKPSTKEQAVLMLADCVEAASHSIKEYTEENICKLVDSIVESKLKDGELEMSPITFQDIHTIKTVFKKRLMAIYHTRISYPTEKKQE